METHTEAFYSIYTSEVDNIEPILNPITSSTPVYKPYPTLPSSDEIRVVHTPESQIAPLIVSISNSPSILDNDNTQQAEAEITRLKNRILILVSGL